jgi:hypothetical protein
VPFAISVIYRDQRVKLTQPAPFETPVAIPAEYVTLEIEGDGLPTVVLLDSKPRPLALDASAKRGYLPVDVFRSVGFHCLQVGQEEYFFATEDAKLKLSGVLTLLRFLEHEGLSFGQQMFFSDGTSIRDSRIDYAWLQDKTAELVAVSQAIADRPARIFRTEHILGPPGSCRIAVRQTVGLIRSNPRAMLEPHLDGVVKFRAARYMPRLAVMTARERSFDHLSNLRVTRLLEHSRSLGAQLKAVRELPPDAKAVLNRVCEQLHACLQLFPFSSLRDRGTDLPDRPTALEMVDERYVTTFRLHEELTKELSWEPSTKLADRFAYVRYADQIYQAFVALTLARAAGAERVGRSLRPYLSRPSLRSERFDFYYDTVPPTPEFLNWRSASPRPTDMRPDLTVIDRPGNRGVMIDAKYRVEKDHVSSSALDDYHVYMQAFECKSIVVCYPGSRPSVSHIAADDYDIVQVSLAPFDGLADYVAKDIWPAIEAAMRPVRG